MKTANLTPAAVALELIAHLDKALAKVKPVVTGKDGNGKAIVGEITVLPIHTVRKVCDNLGAILPLFVKDGRLESAPDAETLLKTMIADGSIVFVGKGEGLTFGERKIRLPKAGSNRRRDVAVSSFAATFGK